MAEAGDGAARSETRRRKAQIRVRVTAAEKTRIERQAARHGHTTAAAYLRAAALANRSMSPRDRRIVGLLALIGGWLSEADALLTTAACCGAAQLRERGREIISMQRELMEGADDSQGDQDA